MFQNAVRIQHRRAERRTDPLPNVAAVLEPDLLGMCTGQCGFPGRRPELYEPLATPTGAELDPRAAHFGQK